jgi:hypothetical protein
MRFHTDGFSETLDAGTPQSEYSKRVATRVLHLGQLKLLCSEIQFLNHVGAYDECTLIYAGASPGDHIPHLMGMFPTLKLILVDPQESVVPQSSRVRIIRDFMTDKLAIQLANECGEKTLFVSDVRIGGEAHETDDKQQERIERDMQAQMQWHELLNPRASLLKFRLPWNRPKSTYLDGTIFLPIFGKRLTHESRLFVLRGAVQRQYNNTQYEHQMAHFNQITRHAVHPGGMCFDCSSLVHLLGEDGTRVKSKFIAMKEARRLRLSGRVSRRG